MHKSYRSLVGGLAMLLFLLTGCGTATLKATTSVPETSIPTISLAPTFTPTPTIIPTPTISVYGPEEYPAGMDPLTGLVVDDPALLARCPLVIKVSNYPRSGRPHAGLSQADLVFDYYIGEGMNRFAAVYYGKDAIKVGPIRSARLVDVQLADMYQGILAFKGAWYKVNEYVYSNLKKRAISGSPSTCPGICDTGNETVISMFANTAELSQYTLDKGICTSDRPVLAGMTFSEELPGDGRPAPDLSVIFSYYNRAEWHYDVASETYLRWIETVSGEEGQEIIKMVPLTDANTGLQLAFENVAILFTMHDMYASTYFDMQLESNISGARLVLLREGKAFDGVWKSGGKGQPLQFFTPEGDHLTFNPGKTWFIIVGSKSTLTTPPDAMWVLDNTLP
jgi:hypothetical protein